MPLSEDQRAMLQLLLQRRQSYEDIGSLLGLEVDEVRERARAALSEISGEDPDRAVGLTDYLLGQADPIGRADVARHLQSEPDSRALAEKLLAQLRLLAPDAALPKLPDARPGRPSRPVKVAGPGGEPSTAERGSALSNLSRPQRRLIAALLGGGVLVAIVVLLATGAFSGDDGEAKPTAAGTDAVTAGSGEGGSGEGATATEGQLTRAVLTSQGGGEARGVALFGRIRGVPVLEVRAVGLRPSGEARSYSVWLYQSDRVALRIGAVKVGESGRILSQVPLPAQALGFVANGTFGSIVVSLTDDQAFAAEVQKAREGRRLPRFLGQPVMRGPIRGSGVQGAANGSGG